MNDTSMKLKKASSGEVPNPKAEYSVSTTTMKRKRKSTKGTINWKSAASIITFFILWELFSRFNVDYTWMNPLFIPAPSVIVQRLVEMTQSGIIMESLLSSTIRIVIGFLLGGTAAVGLGIVMSRFRLFDAWVSPILNMVGPIPALALLPMFIVWFGIGEVPKILLIAWTTFIPIHVYTLDGLNAVNSNYIRSAMTLGASQRQIFTRVILPSALPNIIVGAQISLGLAFSSLVVSEMMGAKSGLGYLIVDARNYFKISDMFVAIVLIGLEYSLLAFMLKRLEKRFVSWRKGGLQSAVEK